MTTPNSLLEEFGDIYVSMTPPLPFSPGDHFEANFAGIGTVAVVIDA